MNNWYIGLSFDSYQAIKSILEFMTQYRTIDFSKYRISTGSKWVGSFVVCFIPKQTMLD